MSTAFRGSPLALTVLALLHYKPLHPYGIQRMIKDWGKDLVVNVEQRTSLYRTIDRLAEAGLVAVLDTERDHAYPERTVYEVTDAGREAAREWLVDLLAVPKREFPQFPAALSHLLLLSPEEIPDLLERRLAAVTASMAELQTALTGQAEGGLHRAGLLELEYLHAVAVAENRWLTALIDDLRSGRLTWSPADFADPQ
ncbi:PadR family transcriptional regulator [Streptosporangium roseum]|uniref:PadR family transcriptional regulator n=1 Tax=Streptosporangium roseum TaxID=2001 RepID=UPI0004CCC28B|nr:PadR family transcriptional regulator [Streptosporangium roseum]